MVGGVAMGRLFKYWLVIAACGLAASSGATQSMAATQTLVFIRHGEKPEAGLGQLNCQGLNRALRLPAIIDRKFGRPDAMFAPNPAELKDDKGTNYAYLRPLATIEPLAIRYGMPVNVQFGFEDIKGLKANLSAPQYADKTLVIAWEHKKLVKLVKKLLEDNHGDASSVPKWDGSDFDSIYVVKIARNGGETSAKLVLDRQGLDNLPTACPNR